MARQMKLAVLKAPQTAAKPARAKRKPVENLSGLLQTLGDLCADGKSDQVTIRDILDAVGRRSYGPLLLAIGLIALSPLTLIPGGTWIVALVTLLIAGQMAVGLKTPWLPKGVQDASAPRKLMLGFVDKAMPWAMRVDKYLKPRAAFLTQPPFVNLIALLCVAAALITIPLSFVPLAPAIPSLAIALFGLGMTARDGLLLGFGIALIAASAWLISQIPWPF